MLKYRNCYFPRLHKWASAFVVPKALLMAIAFLAMWGSVSSQNYVVVGPAFTGTLDKFQKSCCADGLKEFKPEISNSISPALGIYIEKRSPAGFVYGIEVSKLFRSPAVTIPEIPIRIKGPALNPILVTAQIGYRFIPMEKFTIGLFAGITSDLFFPARTGKGQMVEFEEFQVITHRLRFRNDYYLGAKVDATYSISSSWMLAFGLSSSGRLTTFGGGNPFFLNVVENGVLVYQAGWVIDRYPIGCHFGLRWKFME